MLSNPEGSPQQPGKDPSPSESAIHRIEQWLDKHFVFIQKGRPPASEAEEKIQQEFDAMRQNDPFFGLAYALRLAPLGSEVHTAIEQRLREAREKLDAELQQRRNDRAQAEHTPINLNHNVFNHYEETLAAMASIEGEGWKARQNDPNSDVNLRQAIEVARQGVVHRVYGEGGYNRWFVRPDGSVYFDEAFAKSSDDMVKAKLLGFEIRKRGE